MPAPEHSKLTDGTRLKELLKMHGYDAADVAKKLAISEAGVYYYFAQEKMKRKKVIEILSKMKIDASEYYPDEQPNILNEPAQATYNNYHHGRNLEKILDDRQINKGRFALDCNISRQTLYRYFLEPELDAGFLLIAAEKLNIPVAEIKGLGKGQRSFEKDVYNIMRTLSDQITTMNGNVTRIMQHLKIE